MGNYSLALGRPLARAGLRSQAVSDLSLLEDTKKNADSRLRGLHKRL